MKINQKIIEHDSNNTRRINVSILAICQGFFTCAIAIDLTLTAITGYQLAPNKAYATLPFALITVAGALVTLFASHLIQRIGPRIGFSIGALAGVLGGCISVWAVIQKDFWVFCAGTACVGVFQAFAQYYRLAAADSVAVETKGKAISAVLAGGVLAAVLGPAIASWSKDLIPNALFAGAYLMVAVFSALSVAAFLLFYRDSREKRIDVMVAHEPARPVLSVIKQPIFLAATFNTVIGSVVMMLIMTAAPLAAIACGHSVNDGAGIIQWHLIGMYAPSFFAGYLIDRFGTVSILVCGVLLSGLCAIFAVTSSQLAVFFLALFFLGVGWNFMFVGGTMLLAKACRPSERAKTQGIAEFIRYATTALATLAAGPLLNRYGWERINLAIFPLLILCAAVTLWWFWRERTHAKVMKPGLESGS